MELKLIGRLCLILALTTFIWFVLHSTTGSAHRFAFGLTNLVLLGYWFSVLLGSYRKRFPVYNFPGLSMVGFGLTLVMVTLTGNHSEVDMAYIPYAVLISYAGFILASFGTFSPEIIYAPGGFLDRHPLLSISFSLISIVGVLGCILWWVAAHLG